MAGADVDRRVVDVQRQATATLWLTLAFVVAAGVAVVAEARTGDWLAIHLFLVGGLLTAISAATQMLAVTWSASPAPSDRRASVQRWAVAAGAVAVAAGRERDLQAVTALGGVAVGVGLVLLAANLLAIRRTGRNDRFHPAIDAYLAALCWGGVGIAAGIVMATIDPGPWWGRVRDAHVAINVFGLVGLVIAGTLPYFAATQARTKMHPGASPAAMRARFGALNVAVAVAVAGRVLEVDALVSAGLLGYAAALVALVALLPRIRRRQLDWAGPRLVQLGAGIAWWVLATLWLAASELIDGIDPGRALRVLVVGGFAQIVVASLAYFGPVLRAGGHQRLTAGFSVTRSLPSLVAGNVAASALLVGAGTAAAAAVAVWVLDVVVRAARLTRPA